MNEIINKLKNKISEFQNQELYIEIKDALQYETTIKNSKIIVSNQKLIISDEEQKDFIIELHYLDSLKIDESTIKLIMDNDLIINITGM